MSLHKLLTGSDLHQPLAHKESHQDGNIDEISVEGLAGETANLATHKGNETNPHSKTKLNATIAPTINDDSTADYSVGSRWMDITNDKEYVCLDATVGAAVWTETTQAGGAVDPHKDTHDPEDGSDPLDTATPVDISTANAKGSSHSFPRADHIHKHPSGLGASLHHNQLHYHDAETLQHDGINSDGGAFAFTTTGDVTFNKTVVISGIGDGGLTNYDLKVGDTDGTPTYGMIQIGNASFGRTSYKVGSIDLDGTILFRNVGGPVTSQIEFIFTESTGNTCRFALPKSGVGNATYNPRSMLLAGPAPADTDFVKVSYWQGTGIFHNLACDTVGSGADLGVQNDLEVEGDIFVDSIKESTSGAGITFNQNLILPANGSIGVADGNPQIVFDNVNNWLEITGKIGIGTATPSTTFEMVDNLNYTESLLKLSYTGFTSFLHVGFGFSADKSPGYPIGGAIYLSPTIWFKNGTNVSTISYGVYENWDCYGDWEQHGAMRGYPLITAGPSTGAPLQFRSDIAAPPFAVWGEINFIGDDEVFDFSHGIRAVDGGIDVSPAITLNSIFEVNGAEGLAIETVTGNTTLDVTHSTLLVNASGNVVITLPTAASAYNSTDGIGRIYEIKKIDSGLDTVTIDGNGAEEIDGETTQVLITQYQTLTIQSNGTAWSII